MTHSILCHYFSTSSPYFSGYFQSLILSLYLLLALYVLPFPSYLILLLFFIPAVYISHVSSSLFPSQSSIPINAPESYLFTLISF